MKWSLGALKPNVVLIKDGVKIKERLKEKVVFDQRWPYTKCGFHQR